MRVITKNIVSAFLNRTNKASGNTTTNGTSLFLHGNEIARHTPQGLQITNAGWFSNTTKERLNALPNVSICQKKGVWYLNGKEWDGKWVLPAMFA